MKEPGPIALRAAHDCEANLHVEEEGANNRGLAVEIYLAYSKPPLQPGNPWCAAMLSYRLQRAAKAVGIDIPVGFPLSGYTPDYKAWALNYNVWIPAGAASGKVKRGDFVCFYKPAKKRIAHIGQVVYANVEGFCSIEGNTTRQRTVVSEGDEVCTKFYYFGELHEESGFVRIHF